MSDPRPRIHVALPGGGRPCPIAIGVPLPRGWCDDPASLRAIPGDGAAELPLQARALARWSDGSVRWLLASAIVPGGDESGASRSIDLVRDDDARGGIAVDAGPVVEVRETAGAVDVDAGALRMRVSAADGAIAIEDPASGASAAVALSLTGRWPRRLGVRVDRVKVEERGPVRAVISIHGRFSVGCPLEFVARWTLFAGNPVAGLSLRVRNPRAARHPGGLWDLGDPGSWLIGDLSVEVVPGFAAGHLERRLRPEDAPRRLDPDPWAVYQDSSGGERWDSPAHVDADGRLGLSFRGFAVRGEGSEGPSAEGRHRAQPTLCVADAGGTRRISLGIRDFWQNFPKALRWNTRALTAGLFPRERGRPIELQGGEQKRHELAIGVGPDAMGAVESTLSPAHAWVDPAWVDATGAVPGFTVDLSGCAAWTDYVRTIVDGPDGFVERRERVDEYGWRHFGDLWADHEAVGSDGATPFVSHYNNQYDFVFAAGLHALRTGDPRWSRLAREAADHLVDIDLYHTTRDRPAFNGGLFWHTDHYVPARTSSHRAYSRANASGGDYGGGPSNEQNYATGLLLHHWRTGDPDALEGVVGLADWVVAMDDGERTLFALADAGPTGMASSTVEPGYHGPGRGAGNSISTLIDGFVATRRRGYLEKAEALIRRCVHPDDDVDARGLGDVEHRWSYLVFLQVLGKYLELKRELGENDWSFQYARHSLLRYADWMLEHEVPYREVLHKVELPTETWPAHDIRKCHVFHLAARFDDRGRSETFRHRAAFFYERCLADLGTFETRRLTRPLVLLAVHGHLHRHHERLAPIPDAERRSWRHAHDFGAPQPFTPQRGRFRDTVAARLQAARAEVRRLVRDRMGRRARAARFVREPSP